MSVNGFGQSEFEFLEGDPHLKGTTSDAEWEAAWIAFREDTFDPDDPYSAETVEPEIVRKAPARHPAYVPPPAFSSHSTATSTPPPYVQDHYQPGLQTW